MEDNVNDKKILALSTLRMCKVLELSKVVLIQYTILNILASKLNKKCEFATKFYHHVWLKSDLLLVELFVLAARKSVHWFFQKSKTRKIFQSVVFWWNF